MTPGQLETLQKLREELRKAYAKSDAFEEAKTGADLLRFYRNNHHFDDASILVGEDLDAIRIDTDPATVTKAGEVRRSEAKLPTLLNR